MKHDEGMQWPVEKKIRVVKQWLMLGNLTQVSVLEKVPYDTLRKWKKSSWWAELVAEVRTTESIELDGKMSSIMNKSLDAVLDRIENGDFIYDQKSGEIRRKPAALRDIHRVAVDVLTKRELIRDKSEESKQVAALTVTEHLKMLADEMAKWQKPKQIAIVNEDVEDVEHRTNDDPIDSFSDSVEGEMNHAIYEEREAGLQEGTPVGTHEEAGEGEGTSSPELGSLDDGESREGSQG